MIDRVTAELKKRSSSAGLATRERHRVAMERAKRSIQRTSWLLEQDSDMEEVAAEELRSAIRALESLVGRVDVENLLDEIFASFCLGK